MPGGFSHSLEASVLDHILMEAGGMTQPTNLFVGLSSTTPVDDATNVTEPSTGGYARQSTDGTTWAATTGGAPTTKDNGVAITFPQATADYLAGANLTDVVVYDSLTLTALANFFFHGPLGTPKPVLNGDTASFAIGDLDVTLD